MKPIAVSLQRLSLQSAVPYSSPFTITADVCKVQLKFLTSYMMEVLLMLPLKKQE